jgi:hypothetical protein
MKGFALFCALLLSGIGCSTLPLTGGAGEETTNGRVAGKVFDRYGEYAARTQVMLLPADYSPLADNGTIRIDTTDDKGDYSFVNIDSGLYCISAVNLAARTRFLASGIRVTVNGAPQRVDTLRTPGSVRVLLPDSIDNSKGYLYFAGTMIFKALTGASGPVTIDSVPAGAVSAVRYAPRTGVTQTDLIAANVVVASGATSVVAFSGWSFSQKLFLNTASTGAAVSGNVGGFPALIRLTNSNFNFSQAQSDGADLRFTKSDGTSLPYEIERWDASMSAAEIWARIDTVFGNDSTHYIVMYWGASTGSATSLSNGAEVFDTADGFETVWHMSDSGDASERHHAGLVAGAGDTTGIIGRAKSFDGYDSIVISGLLGTPSSVTLSAWVRTDISTANGQEVVSIGDAVLMRADEWGMGGCLGAFHVDSAMHGDTNYLEVGYSPLIAKSGWRYMTFTFDATHHSQTLYIDGNPSITRSFIDPILYTGVGNSTIIGFHGNGKSNYGFFGSIDEVRVSKVVRSVDWIKLCYMNQKLQDKLIRFK